MNMVLADRIPWVSISLGALAAAAFVVAGPAPESLVYDRSAIASGELWRLATGHLAHADLSHVAVNVLALGLLGVLFEPPPRRWLVWLLLFIVSAAAVNVWLWLLRPEISLYCGLSGALHGLFAGGLLMRWREGRHRRMFAVIGLAATAKLLADVTVGNGLFEHTSWPSLPGAHVAGAVAGAASVAMRRDKHET